jgi:hypothetical protein
VEGGVEQHAVIERVLADQGRRNVARDDAERGNATLHRRGLADPGEAVIAMHPDKGAALLRLVVRPPADLKDLDVGDFHGGPTPSKGSPVAALSALHRYE